MVLTYEPLRPGEALSEIPPESKFVPGMGAILVRDEGEVVGVCGISSAIQLDPLWVRPDYRGHPTLLADGWAVLRAYLAMHFAPLGIRKVSVAMLPDDPGPEFEEKVANLCRRCGGEEFMGRTFILPLTE